MTLQDVKKLFQHWMTGSDYDWKTALSLYQSKRFPYALFFVHLSLEKFLKAILVHQNKNHAPHTHNLAYLAGKIDIEFQKEQIQLLEEMNEFNLESRYPDDRMDFYKKANAAFTKIYLKKGEEFRKWLKKRFSIKS